MNRRPHLAILGAGPTGIDAALAATDAGLPFTLYEAGDQVAAYLRQWGHVRLFSPWDLDVSPRIRQALERLGTWAPHGSDCPTGDDLVNRVFQPLAECPAIAPSLRLNCRVTAIGREGLLKHQAIGDPARGQHPFRLLVRQADDGVQADSADVVLDCTGTYGQPNPTGDGGIPAPGEEDLGDRIVRMIPDFAVDTESWAGSRILLVGAGHSAQTAITDLASLAQSHPGTEIVWAIRRPRAEWPLTENDPLPGRADLVRAAQALAQGTSEHVQCLTGVVVESIATDGDKLRVDLRSHDGHRRSETVDKIVSLTGFSGDHLLYRQLQVHECWATSGPMKLAASLLAESSANCLDQTCQGVETLLNPEPDFFILGSKSYGRNSTFLMRVGWQQVDEVFTLLRRRPPAETVLAGSRQNTDTRRSV